MDELMGVSMSMVVCFKPAIDSDNAGQAFCLILPGRELVRERPAERRLKAAHRISLIRNVFSCINGSVFEARLRYTLQN